MLRKSQRDGYVLAVIAGIGIGAVVVLIIMNRQRLGLPLARPAYLNAAPQQNTTQIVRNEEGLIEKVVQERTGGPQGGVVVNYQPNVSIDVG